MKPEHTGSSEAPWSGRRGGRRRAGGPPPFGPEQERLITAWFAGRIPEGWFEGPVNIEIDPDELRPREALDLLYELRGLLAPRDQPQDVG